ncbi:unnamed protein product [Vicia faba]|uniref:Bifunctional inhibitor/plant lipid transfer protein/seed storage helical domain-containing protein n=1 Tax=Vicia faba TaxID=3906 RepID=A0AAV1AH49_VICFA|nr:unnamed protein product [Vicia faba]
MGGRRSIACLASLMVGMVLIMMINSTEAQDTTSCASNLIPCADFLNSTKPPSSCCDPLKKTVETQLTCLCNLFYTPGLLETFHVNITQALGLAGKCGIPGGISSCKQAGSAPAPTAGGSPSAKGGGESGDKGGAGRVSFTGFSFVLLLASMLFN